MNSKARILVIDDHERTVKAIEEILQEQGYEVLTAFEGATGLQRAREEKPDLIILDIMMPGMDGYEVCQRLQSDPATARIAVLMLTGKGRVDAARPGLGPLVLQQRVREQLDAFDAGAVEFLTKPLRAKELLKRVKGLLWIRGIQS
jgi:DNA-binding response OmpR family regulator